MSDAEQISERVVRANRQKSKDKLCVRMAESGSWCCSYHEGYEDGADAALREANMLREGTMTPKQLDAVIKLLYRADSIASAIAHRGFNKGEPGSGLGDSHALATLSKDCRRTIEQLRNAALDPTCPSPHSAPS